MENRLYLLLALFFTMPGVDAQEDCPPSGNMLAVLAGSETNSTSFSGSGTPLFLDVDLVFIDQSNQFSWAGDLALFITAPDGTCAQMGGYNNPIDSNCTQLGNINVVWPDWATSESGAYSATVDLQGSGLAGSGTWQITAMNGFTDVSGAVTYDLSWAFECVIDTTPPSIEVSNCPNDTQLFNACGPETNLGAEFLGFPSFGVSDDVCQGDVDLDVSMNDTYFPICGQAQSGQPSGSFTIERTFTAVATDCSGNQSMATCTQTIQVIDNEGPQLAVDCPGNVTIALDANCEIPYYALAPDNTGVPYVQASDACDPQVDISINFYDQEPVENDTGLGFSLVRDWFISAVDDCGNATFMECSQLITVETGDCVLILGCIYPDAVNFNPDATEDDGSCAFSVYEPVYGCTQPEACNFSSSATYDDGSCEVPGICQYCLEGLLVTTDTDGDEVCDGEEVLGCTSPSACNFNPLATDDDGGCKSLDACGVCDGPGAIYACGCSDLPPEDCDCDGHQYDAVGVCGGDCTADIDGDGICDALETGCTYIDGINYDPEALIDDGSCEISTPILCPTDIDQDGVTDTQDLILLLGNFSLACGE